MADDINLIDPTDASNSEDINSSEENTLSVGQFLDQLNEVLEPNQVTIRGELGEINTRGKAIYFSLRDKDDDAVLNCFVWQWEMVRFGFNFEEGMEVKILGYPKIYKPNGRLSFQVEYMTPVGEGALKKAYDLLVKKLENLGYFEEERKRPIPLYVKKIGLITSEQADAKKDFLTHLGQHDFQIYFYDVRVEGLKSMEEISKAIKWFNESTVDVEVLVLTRGGGNFESLEAFNSEIVAKAIYSSKIPIISAIGHENDVTISDMVADVRASTPTDAGKQLAEPWILAKHLVINCQDNILSAFARTIRQNNTDLKQRAEDFINDFEKILFKRKNEVENLSRILLNSFRQILERFRELERTFKKNSVFVERQIDQFDQEIRRQKEKLLSYGGTWLRFLANKIQNIDEKLLLVDPAQKLKQGYSLVFNQGGNVVKSVESLILGDNLDITFFKGKTKSKIIKILK